VRLPTLSFPLLTKSVRSGAPPHFAYRNPLIQCLRTENWVIGNGQLLLNIGIISDTHGRLRPEAVEVLRGSEQIIHAGDVGDAKILDQLSAIAPVSAVRGNIDKSAWARKLPQTTVVEAAGVSIYVLHNLEELDLKPEAAGFAAVIYGHSHVSKQEMRNGVLYFNPGSAGPRRFKLPISVGRLRVERGKVFAEIIVIAE
jgi:uncharacterized protein